MGFIVAIDGPSGSGKGTITKLVGEKLGLINIDTGAMYRCVALDCLNNNVSYTNLDRIEEILKKINIELKKIDGKQKVFLNGVDVSFEIRTPKVDNVVSEYSAIKCVRDKITPMQQKMGEAQDIIMEGRDIGTVVFPNADVKIFLDCSVEERARRRYLQNQEEGINLTYEEVLKNIKARDKSATERKIAPLVKADDAILVDSTNLSIDEVVEKIINIINEKGKKIKKQKKSKKSKKEQTAFSRFWKKISRAIVKGVIFAYCKIIYRVKIIGTENIPKDGALIFCGNHRSFLDPPLMEVTCKRDDTRFIAKKELTKNKGLALLGIIFDAILVNRDSKDVGALKESLKTLKSGGCIAIFPEGTRNGITKGEKAKDGVAYFALNSDAKVIPVGISGGLKPFQKAVITYGNPIDFTEYKANRKDKDTMEKVTNEIMMEIMKLV